MKCTGVERGETKRSGVVESAVEWRELKGHVVELREMK